MWKQKAIRIYGVLSLITVVIWLTTYPPVVGSGQKRADDHPIPKTEVSDSFEVAELKHDIEKGLEKLGERISEKPKVVVKPKVRTIPIKVPLDSAAVWLRHPDGSVERVTFSTSQVPIINLVSDTIVDTIKLKRKWVLFGPYREF